MATSKALTLRQDEVLRLVAEGHTDQEIADRFGVSRTTIVQHLVDIRCALDARSRAHAVWRAVCEGYLQPAVLS